MFDYDPYALLDPVPSFALASADLVDGGPVPTAQYGAGAGGSDTSPRLSWSGAPEGTRGYAVTCFDPDAPTGSGYWHWAAYNLPADCLELPADAGRPGSHLLPEGAVTLPNDARVRGFVGAGPPEGTGVHRYIFVVHALDVDRLEIDPEMPPAVLGFTMHFHTLARAILTVHGEFGGADAAPSHA